MTNETKKFNYLQSYRKRIGISSKDMAYLIGMDTGNLSKMETGKREPSLLVIISYYLILNIPIHNLFKNEFKETISSCMRNAISLKDSMLERMTTPELNHSVILLDNVIDSLIEQERKYV